MKPPLLAELLRDPAAVAERAVKLKQLLPRTNVSAMASKQPELLLQVTPAVLHALPALRWLLCVGCCAACFACFEVAAVFPLLVWLHKLAFAAVSIIMWLVNLMSCQTVTCAPQTARTYARLMFEMYEHAKQGCLLLMQLNRTVIPSSHDQP